MADEMPPQVAHSERAQEHIRQAQQALLGVTGVGVDLKYIQTAQHELDAAMDELDAEGER